jgi:predicted transcriptional regulator
MASKQSKTLYVDLNAKEGGVISKFLNRNTKNTEYNPKDVELLRKLFSNEKMRILYTLKNKKPKSIYHLAMLLERNFKSVYQDLKLLERFGFIEFYAEKTGKRESLRPILKLDSLKLVLTI